MADITVVVSVTTVVGRHFLSNIYSIFFTGFGISPADGVKVDVPQLEEDLPVVWLTDEEWVTKW